MDSNDTPPFNSPPQYSAPPPIITSPLPSRPRKSRGWMILSLILIALLAFSLLGNFGQWLGGLMPDRVAQLSSSRSGVQLEETLVDDNHSQNKIVLVDVSGIITSRTTDQGGLTMVEKIKEELKRAKEDNRVKAVLLRVDSPGGEVLASDEIYRLLVKFQDESRKPVITSMGNLAASGGYYISSASRWIVANQMTITGSIGVILHSYNYRGLMDKIGLQPDVYKSGKHKDMLSGEREPNEIPDDEREMVQSLIDETYGRFVSVVETGRSSAHAKNKTEGKPLADDWKNYADGRVLSGSKALELGFVDEVGDLDKAFERARVLTHIEKSNLVEYKVRYDFSDLFRLFGKSEGATLKVDLGMPGPKLETGHLYFLAPTFLH